MDGHAVSRCTFGTQVEYDAVALGVIDCDMLPKLRLQPVGAAASESTDESTASASSSEPSPPETSSDGDSAPETVTPPKTPPSSPDDNAHLLVPSLEERRRVAGAKRTLVFPLRRCPLRTPRCHVDMPPTARAVPQPRWVMSGDGDSLAATEKSICCPPQPAASTATPTTRLPKQVSTGLDVVCHASQLRDASTIVDNPSERLLKCTYSLKPSVDTALIEADTPHTAVFHTRDATNTHNAQVCGHRIPDGFEPWRAGSHVCTEGGTFNLWREELRFVAALRERIDDAAALTPDSEGDLEGFEAWRAGLLKD